MVDKTFDGSLPRFVAAFLNSKPISAAEAAEIRALLDAAQSIRRNSHAQHRACRFCCSAPRGGAAALAAWLVCRARCAAPMRPAGSCAGCGWPWDCGSCCPLASRLPLPRPQNTQLAEAADTVQALTQPELTAPDLPPMVPAAAAAAALLPWYTTTDRCGMLLAAVWAGGRGYCWPCVPCGATCACPASVALACKTPDGCFSGPCVPTPFTLGSAAARASTCPPGWHGPARDAVHACTSAPTSAGATR